MMTIREIAREAGVAPSTVSLVLNGKPGVRRETRAKVALLLTANGYAIRQNGASPIAQGEIKFVRYQSREHESERTEDFFAALLNGAEYRARRAGFTLSITNVESAHFPQFLDGLRQPQSAAGIVLLASELEAEMAVLLTESVVPLVCLENRFTHLPLNNIAIDNEAGAYEACCYLYDLGHRRIGFLRGAVDIGGVAKRYMGYRQAMDGLDLPVPAGSVVDIDLLFNKATEQMLAHLKRHAGDLPTAFLAGNDIIAAGCERALIQFGLRVPEDISIVGFDDGAMSTIVTPALTTMRVDRMRMGELAVERLLTMLQGDRSIVKANLGVTLVERASSGPAPKA